MITDGPLDTLYFAGHCYEMGFDPKVFKLDHYERQEWARKWLKDNGHDTHFCNYVIPVYRGNPRPVAMFVSTYDYKEKNLARY